MRNPAHKFFDFFVIISILLAGFLSLSEQGISWDEPLHILLPKFNYLHLTSRQAIPLDLRYYGPFFDALVAGFSSFANLFIKRDVNDFSVYSLERFVVWGIDGSTEAMELWRYQQKHLFTFLFSLLTYYSVAKLAGLLLNKKKCLLAALILALTPHFWAHSLFNPKDAPFAALFTLSTYVGARLVNSSAQNNISAKQVYFLSGVFAMLVACASSIRIGAFVLIFYLAFTQVILNAKHLFSFSKRVFIQYSSILLIWSALTILMNPASWAAPHYWLYETLHYFAHHPHAAPLTFLGEHLTGKDVPWYYLAVWFFVSTPFGVLLAALMGFVFLLVRLNKISLSAKNAFLMLSLQLFCLPLASVVFSSSLDSGIRQFLFVLPCFSVFAAYFLVTLYNYLLTKKIILAQAFAGICALFLFSIAKEMYQLHPYQHVYFSSAARAIYSEGSENVGTKFDTDYWGLSMREAAEWLNSRAEPNATVLVRGPYHSAAVFLRPDLNVLPYSAKSELLRPAYYISPPRLNWLDQRSDCSNLFQVERSLGGTKLGLSIVKKCPSTFQQALLR